MVKSKKSKSKMDIKQENLAVVLYGPNDLRVEETPLPGRLAADDVLVKGEFCGICGTDVHLMKHAKVGTFAVERPLILGHEGCGTIIDVGKNVHNLAVGDRVVIENAVPCMKCKFCLKGTYNYCKVCSRQAKGLPPADGLLRRFYTHPAAFVHKIPDSLSFEISALAEPLAVSVHAVNRVGLTYGHTVLICGAGTMGLLTMITARAYGAAKICMVDMVKEKLDIAMKNGADCVVLSTKGNTPESVADKIVASIGGPADITFEATGSEFCLTISILATTEGGKIGLIGLGPEKVSIPLSKSSLKEIDLMGICRYRNSYPQAVKLLKSRKEFKSFITSVFPIESSLEAFEQMQKGTDIKVLIKCN